MKKLIKKILLKISGFLKLGLIDDAWLLYPPPTDNVIPAHLNLKRLRFVYKVPLFQLYNHGDKIQDFVKIKISNEFVENVLPYIKITSYENRALDEITVCAELNILEDVDSN